MARLGRGHELARQPLRVAADRAGRWPTGRRRSLGPWPSGPTRNANEKYIDAVGTFYRTPQPSTTQRGRRHTPRPWGTGRGVPGGHRGADLLRARARRHRRPHRQDLCQPEEGRRTPGTDLRRPARPPGRGPLPDPQLRLPSRRRRGIKAAERYSKIAPRAPTPCTCRRTSSPGSATGTPRSPPTASPRNRRRRNSPLDMRRAPGPTTPCTRWTT